MIGNASLSGSRLRMIAVSDRRVYHSVDTVENGGVVFQVDVNPQNGLETLDLFEYVTQ